MAYDFAYRRIKTSSTGYRKIEATITLPSLNDINIESGAALYEYLGCDGSTFDFEFGFGLAPSDGYSTKYGIYRSINVGGSDWQWIPGYTFDPGSTYRLLIAAENGYIKCYVYNASGTLLYSNNFTVSGIRFDGSGQRVRRVSTLLVPSGGSANVNNNRWITTLVGTPTTFVNATSSNCTATNETNPSGQPWISVTTFNTYYNENINLDIR
ncbi:hypothetical protein [Thermosediminibacter oceani]|uniref:Uncharacterized protein n=1 Tax=Thermosediminibacter oceani (strain ATCC BAA-1034 / DSM 16646 / JW/IW-1228P) TaxID=555079 RepID=D9S162_THEOJ|nr:hypothetical protein [Thermosediminibacter oceani]ADL08941.1 hypothetical protein Toce_2230 [Thermosediminibacter oceani DSM 16646]